MAVWNTRFESMQFVSTFAYPSRRQGAGIPLRTFQRWRLRMASRSILQGDGCAEGNIKAHLVGIGRDRV